MSRIFKMILTCYNFLAWLIGNLILLAGICGVSLVGYVLIGDLIRNKKEFRREKSCNDC